MAFAIPASAQISITFEEFVAGYASGISSPSDHYSSTDLSGVSNLIALKGAGANWNFGARTYTKNTDEGAIVSLVDVASAPLSSDPDFTGATHCIKIKGETSTDFDVYQYLKITSDGQFTMGTVFDSAGTSTKFVSYVPPLQQMKFPLTYGTSWSSTSNVKTPYSQPGMTQTETSEAECDGWGTLELPARTYKEQKPTATTNTIRLRLKQTSTTSFGVYSINTVTHTYTWYTEGSTSASIVSDTNDSPISIGYSQGATGTSVATEFENPLSVKLSANPANAQTSLSYNLKESADVQVSIMDNLGRQVKMLHNGYANAGSNLIPIDPSTLANGSYLIRISSENVRSAIKLVIAK